MNDFVVAAIGFAVAMGIPVFLTAVAESAASRFERTLPARAKAGAGWRQLS